MSITKDLEAKRLGLSHVDRPGFETESGVYFLMAYGERIVRVFVERAAIIGESEDLGQSCAGLFATKRQRFELLAREKFRVNPQLARVVVRRGDTLRSD
jgi:hypothetical protein